MQVNLPTNNLFLGNNPVLDSLVLVLDYAGLYGDSMAQHSFNVYKVIEPLYASKLYYSDSKVLTLPAAIGRKANFVPNLKDSVTVLGNTMPPQLRIRLTDQLGTEFTEGDTPEIPERYHLHQFPERSCCTARYQWRTQQFHDHRESV